MPSFSIVVAAYQAAHVIRDALDSALAQTQPAREVIVCDDGSTDDLESALEPYRKRIVVLRKENGGEASAKNAGVRAATGDFTVFLDADDVFLPERLAALGELASVRPDLDVLTTDAVLEVDGQPVRHCYTDELPFEIADQRAAILERNFVFGLAAVRRSRLLSVGGFDEDIRWTTDWDCWIRLIFSGSRAGLVPEPLARYRLQAGSLSAQRAQLFAGRVQTLGRAARRDDLTDHERLIVTRSRALEGRRLALAEARGALLGELPGARRRAFAVVLGRGHSVRTRVKAAAATVAPQRAGARLARRSRETTGGIQIPPTNREFEREL
jgi:glycosyltransferase involved in cell wall biosynthesis